MSKRLIYYFFLLIYLEGLFTGICSGEDGKTSGDFHYFYSLRRNEGGGLGNQRSYTSISALIFPLSIQDIKAFLDLRYHIQNDCKPYAANFGLGLRHNFRPINTLFGVNAYFDTKKVHRCFLNQLGIGIEAIGDLFNVRLNGYLPIAKKKVKKSSWLFTGYSDGYFILRENYLKTLRGINFEVEAKIAKIKGMSFLLGLGAYYYNSCGTCKKNIYGTEYTLTALTDRFITLKLCSIHDNVFKTRIQLQISLEIPFINLDEVEKRLFQQVKRNELLVTEKRSRWIINF